MNIDKKYFWGQKCFGTHTALPISEQVWVWNWAQNNMTMSFKSRKLHSNIQENVLPFGSVKRLFSKIFPLKFTSKIMHWRPTAKLSNWLFIYIYNLFFFKLKKDATVNFNLVKKPNIYPQIFTLFHLL